MAAHKYIDRVCLAAALCSLLLTLLFVNGEALGVQPASQAMGYEAKLFDTSRVHTVEIVMDGWEEFIETCENEEYAACSVVIDNEAYKNVGIRAKGNTSLSTVSQMGSDRYSFKIEFDQYDSGKTYYGLDKLCLNNLIQDNTMMKDYLAYRLMASFGVNAPLCSYVYITVNGQDWGLYLAVEGVEDAFLQRNYGRDHGALYKPDSMSFGGGRGNGRDFDMDDLMDRDVGQSGPAQLPKDAPEGFDSASLGEQAAGQGGGSAPPKGFSQAVPDGGQAPDGENGGSMPETSGPAERFADGGPGGGFGGGMGSGDVKLQYTDDDPDSYANIFDSAKTDVSEADQARLIQALKALGEGDVESALDIDQVLRYFVVHNFVVNGDSYTGSMVHNYYLYEEDGRLSMLPWDYNLAFGTFQGNDASGAVNDPIDSPLSVAGDGGRPMADWIFASEEYTALYHRYFRQFLDSVDCAAVIDGAYALIAPYVERDPTKFCTYEEFEAGTAALRTFCALRAQSVDSQLSGTVPSTDGGQAADSSALVDASALTLSDMGTMGRGGGFPGGEDGAPTKGALLTPGDGNDWENRRPSGGMGMPERASAGGAPQAGMDTAALILAGASALLLVAGLWGVSRFKRPGGVSYHKSHEAGPVQARHGAGRA